MGLLDFPAPLFQVIDESLEFLPDLLRLSLWALVAGALSMLLYALISPQKRISLVKAELQAARAEMAKADEDFGELMDLVKKNLGLSFRHLGLVFAPALVSALPLLCIIAWSSTRFGYGFPDPGEQVAVSTYPPEAAAALNWRAAGAATPRSDDSGWQVTWPGEGQTLSLADGKQRLVTLPLPAPIPQVHKKLWWNSLLGNPAGYLPDEAPVELVTIELSARRHLPFGPGWLGNWLTVFLVVSVVGALGTKSLFKIH